jgi:hypothetical protein
MEAVSKSGSLVLMLDREELRHLNNALNEVCNGFAVANFEAAIGVTKSQATDLLQRVHRLDGQRRMELALSDLDALRNSLTSVLSELEPWEYSTRMGFEVSESQALRNRLDALASEVRFGRLPQTA